MPCNLGDQCICVDKAQMPYCSHWEPGRTSKYYKCERYIAAKITCDLKRTACPSCPHFLAGGPSRVQNVDWNNPEAVKKWRAEYMQRYRAQQREKESE